MTTSDGLQSKYAIAKRIQLFTAIRDIPYRVNEHADEDDNSCDGKHRKLLDALTEEGYEVRWRSGLFLWRSIGIPEEVASLADGKNWMHEWLEVKLGDAWVAIDATWDRGLRAIFPVYDWDGVSTMPVAVRLHSFFSLKRLPSGYPTFKRQRQYKRGCPKLENLPLH